MKQKQWYASATAVVFIISSPAFAENLALYTFTGSVATPETTQPFVAATPVTLSAGSVTFVSVAGFPNPPYVEGSGGWTASNQSSAKHFLFTLSELNGATLTPTNISLRFRATGAGPEVMGISLNGSSVHTESAPGNTTQTISVPLSGFNDLTQAVLRIEGWLDGSRTSSGGGDFRIDDVLVEGTVDEPVGEFPPSVSAPVSPSRTATTLELGGTITATGGPVVTERGVYYSTISGFTPPGQGTKLSETGTFDVGSFAVEVTGLDPDTEYFYRAFATNAEGTGLSDQASRRTLKTPPPDALVYYTFTEDQLTPEFKDIDISATPFAVSAGSITFGTANAATWTHEDVGAELPYAQSSSGWTGEDQETAKHYRIDLSVEEGRVFTITNISFAHRRTPAGPSETGISIDGASIYTNSLAADSTLLVSIPVIGYAGLSSAVIRIEGWNATGTGSYQIDNVLVQGFLTGDAPPTVTTPTATRLYSVSATLGGTIADAGDAEVIERGVFWATDQGFDPQVDGVRFSETNSFDVGAFELLVENLPPSTTIYYVAFARSANGYGFSDEDSFVTGEIIPYGTIWVNEINYNPSIFDFDNVSEFIELAGPTGFDITEWQIQLYNEFANIYAVYDIPEAILPDDVGGFGFYVIGDADVANVDQHFTHAAGGDAADALSKSGTIRLVHPGGSAVFTLRYGIPLPQGFLDAAWAGHDDYAQQDQSLSLIETGLIGGDFSWTSDLAPTPGAINTDQVFGEPGGGNGPSIYIVSVARGASVALATEGVGDWTAVPQYTTNLVDAIWTDVSVFTNQQAGVTNTFTFSEPTTNQPVIYRVRATE